MSSIASLPSMRAATLTVMSTRSQDQDLVASVASEQGMDRDAPTGAASQHAAGSHANGGARKVVPAFGWHPWFSYQLYDDGAPVAERTYDAEKASREGTLAEKMRHFAAVLSPAPKDEGFATHMPDLKPLSEFVAETRERLRVHPTAMVGEVGLDKAFRLPQPWKADEPSERDPGRTPGGRDGRLLSPHHVRPKHQAAVLKAQLRLAAEMDRSVSVHGVQAHGLLFDTISELWKGHEREVISKRKQRLVAKNAEDFSSSSSEDEDEDDGAALSRGTDNNNNNKQQAAGRPYPPRICLHSFSGSVPVLWQYLDRRIPADIFFSFSTAVNFSTARGDHATPDVIAACPDDRILVESDLHIAGDQMDAALEDMYRRVCEIKGWGLAEGAATIRANFLRFIGPGISSPLSQMGG